MTLKPVLNLERFKLYSRDLIFGYVEVRDNYPGNPPHIVRSGLFAFLIRDYVEQFKLTTKEPEMPSLRKLFEDILVDQERVMQDMWNTLSAPPLEMPTGWDEAPKK